MISTLYFCCLQECCLTCRSVHKWTNERWLYGKILCTWTYFHNFIYQRMYKAVRIILGYGKFWHNYSLVHNNCWDFCQNEDSDETLIKGSHRVLKACHLLSSFLFKLSESKYLYVHACTCTLYIHVHPQTKC